MSSWGSLYKPEELVHLAKERQRPAPFCPECACNDTKSRLRFLHSFSEQWGCVVTRHDVYCCRNGCGRFVSTNNREPELAAPGI